ncbi:iron-siderophore ABC transporter substrate-binding protein [Streptomyces viridochromogenes]|uniref:Iron-siderophore ABC transporter substrate-binding protein n=1 Tax=Streptomyces viridochromogenes TaxID=1938 RepID=A0A0J7ZM94_STRVR|nr:iron-siderophore ABC transporter substrate-binding protein [Streptomyces viridochromogenes]KMS77156.1 iron-siderophore ABC transporter substrate-binding protein [Streptomyces viridochromogenes]KOG09400.1 iron-siderophore ABC transporter substrate-binding protein [Streptomyces viridochromogenes]KOG27306.1 iron-siderophore ABC transporter substrate-binding protein [Streptomyces viridochromogenes]
MFNRSPLRGIGRLIAVLLAVVLGTAVLAACGGADSSSDADDTAKAAGDSSAFPRTLKTVMGDVKIPSQPKRVVVLDTGELDDVTLLGLDPVGAVAPHFKTSGGFPTYLDGELKNTVDVGPLLEPNLEKIASLKPDLILSSKVRHEKVYDKLSAIAPTVFTETTGGVWKENLKVHAEALGLEKEAAAKLKEYETQAAALGAAIKKKDGGTMPTASVVRFIAGPTRLYQTNSYSGVVLNDIGFQRPKSQISNDPEVTMKDVSPEEIDQADADLIFVTAADAEDKTQKKQVVSNPVWKDLPAVKDGKVFEVPDETWMSGIGVQAAEEMLKDVAKATGVELPAK